MSENPTIIAGANKLDELLEQFEWVEDRPVDYEVDTSSGPTEEYLAAMRPQVGDYVLTLLRLIGEGGDLVAIREAAEALADTLLEPVPVPV